MFEWVLEQKGLAGLMDMPAKTGHVTGSTAGDGNPPSSSATAAQNLPTDGERSERCARRNPDVLPHKAPPEQPPSPFFMTAESPTGDFAEDRGFVFEDLLGFNFLDDLGLSSGI
jgi:hypothetical protein